MKPTRALAVVVLSVALRSRIDAGASLAMPPTFARLTAASVPAVVPV